eukprot:gene48043-49129_t
MRRAGVLSSHLHKREKGEGAGGAGAGAAAGAAALSSINGRTPRPQLDPAVRFKFNQPLSGNVMSRFGGITTMMRLP